MVTRKKEATKRRKEIKVVTISGRFRNTMVTEGRKKGEVVEFNPTKRGAPTFYSVGGLKVKDLHVFKEAAGRDIQEKTGLSDEAIKKMGLVVIRTVPDKEKSRTRSQETKTLRLPASRSGRLEYKRSGRGHISL